MPQIIVSNSGDEGQFYSSDSADPTYFHSPPLSLIRVGTQVLSVVGPTYYVHEAWFRFRLPLDGNVLITRAVLRFTTPDGWPDNPHGGVTTETVLKIKAHKTANSSGPSNHADAISQSGGSATSAIVTWTSDLKAKGAMFFSPDIKSVIQELVDQGSWAADNYITVYITSSYQPYYRPCTITSEQFQNSPPPWIDPWILEESALTHLVIDYTIAPLDGEVVEHELVIEQAITATTGRYGLTHTLSIEQDIVGIADKVRSVFDDLVIEQDFKQVLPIEMSVYSDVFFSHEIDRNLVQNLSVENIVSFEQDILRQGPLDKQVISTLDIDNDQVICERAYVRDLESVVEIDQDIDTNIKTRTFIHVLNVRHANATDGSDIQDPENVESIITISQDIDWNRDGTRGTEHDLEIEHFVVGYFDVRTGCDRQDINYQPYADSSVDFPTKPTLTKQDIMLSWTTENITLPMPLFGDREEILLTRIQRTTRGGILKTFSSDVWPKVRTFRYKFDGLDTDLLSDLFDFLGVTLGQQIQLSDHEGRLWNGYIVNPQGEAGQFMRMCGNTTEFDFEGVEV